MEIIPEELPGEVAEFLPLIARKNTHHACVRKDIGGVNTPAGERDSNGPDNLLIFLLHASSGVLC